MRIDLSKDLGLLRKHLQQRVKDHGKSPSKGPGRIGDAVSQITLGYQFDQTGWLAVVFDTRAKPEIDGHWNAFILPNMVNLPHWKEAYDAWSESGKTAEILMPNEKVKKIGKSASDDTWAKVLGVALRKEMESFRDKGGFDKLGLASGTIFTVEEHEGRYGWTDHSAEDEETEEEYLEKLAGSSAKLPREKLIAHWIAVLDRLATGEEKGEWSFVASEHAIGKLMKQKAIVEMLEYVKRWAGKPEWEGDKPGKVEELPMQGPVAEVLTTLENARWKCPEAEPILKDIVRLSCQVNEKRKRWGIIPYWAAMCLFNHFKGYPEPDQGVKDNKLKNTSEFLKS